MEEKSADAMDLIPSDMSTTPAVAAPKISSIIKKGYLTNRQLGLLVTFVPILIHWLRDSGSESVLLLVNDGEVDQLEVQNLLSRFIDALNVSGDLTIRQIKELGELHGPRILAGALRKIITDAEPPIISPTIALDIAKEEDPGQIRIILQDLSRTHFFALGELCALFRDNPGTDFAGFFLLHRVDFWREIQIVMRVSQTVLFVPFFLPLELFLLP